MTFFANKTRKPNNKILIPRNVFEIKFWNFVVEHEKWGIRETDSCNGKVFFALAFDETFFARLGKF